MLWPTSLPLTIKLCVFSPLDAGWRNVVFYGDSIHYSLQSYWCKTLSWKLTWTSPTSCQLNRGSVVPRLELAGSCILVPLLRGIRAAETTSAPSSHRSHKDVTPAIPCFQAWHTTKPTVCYCCLFNTIFRPPRCFLAKFFRLLQGWRGENPSTETKGSFCRSWTVKVGLLCCRDAIFHPTRPGVIYCEASRLTEPLCTC